MNVKDASTNGGNVDLIFNLPDLGLSGQYLSLFYSANEFISWGSVGTKSSSGDIYTFTEY